MADDGDAHDGADDVPEPIKDVEKIDADALNEAVESGAVTTETGIDEDPDTGDPVVHRTAAFAEIADRPKRKALDNDRLKGDVEFRDELRKFDPELAGTIRAKCQSAASGVGVTHPAIEGERTEMKDIEKRITDSCRDLLDQLRLREEMSTYFRNAAVHGDDVSWIGYEEGEGVTDLEPLPLRLLTIVDEQTRREGKLGTPTGFDFDRVISEADYYMLNEGKDNEQPFPEHDILHIALNRRGNWEKDRLGRMTYNVWGETSLEPVKYAVQTKQNTLANKVAMDDKMLTREYYKINVEELFGHIEDPDERQRRTEEYAQDLRQKLQNLDADQKPILPAEVEIEVHGPDGETARNLADFIQTMNDSIQHALTYHVASFGRDAGGTDRGNRPAKEMSDNAVRQLRDVVKTTFRRLFEIHAKMQFEEARQPDPENAGADDHTRYKLADDIVLPTLTFDPVDPEDRNDEVRNAATLYEKGIADLNEARAEANLKPITEEERDERLWHPEKNPTTYDEDLEQQEMENQPTDTDGSRESPNDEPTESRPSYRTNSSLDMDIVRVDPDGETWVTTEAEFEELHNEESPYTATVDDETVYFVHEDAGWWER